MAEARMKVAMGLGEPNTEVPARVLNGISVGQKDGRNRSGFYIATQARPLEGAVGCQPGSVSWL